MQDIRVLIVQDPKTGNFKARVLGWSVEEIEADNLSALERKVESLVRRLPTEASQDPNFVGIWTYRPRSWGMEMW